MGRVPRMGVTVCLFSILVVERSEFLCASEPGSLLRTQQGRPQPDNPDTTLARCVTGMN